MISYTVDCVTDNDRGYFWVRLTQKQFTEWSQKEQESGILKAGVYGKPLHIILVRNVPEDSNNSKLVANKVPNKVSWDDMNISCHDYSIQNNCD